MQGLPPARDLKGHVAVDNALVTFELDSASVGKLEVPSAGSGRKSWVCSAPRGEC